MAMIKCPECGNEISTRAAACVKCGLPMSEIFVCPECSNIMLKEGEEKCLKCGCPILEEDEESFSYDNEQIEEEMNESYIESIFEEVFSLLPISENFVHYFISGGGQPIENLSSEQNAKMVFDVPCDERVFYVTSANVFGGIKPGGKGFAITPQGIYYTDDRKDFGVIRFEEFINLEIYESNYLYIGEHAFNVSNSTFPANISK